MPVAPPLLEDILIDIPLASSPIGQLANQVLLASSMHEVRQCWPVSSSLPRCKTVGPCHETVGPSSTRCTCTSPTTGRVCDAAAPRMIGSPQPLPGRARTYASLEVDQLLVGRFGGVGAIRSKTSQCFRVFFLIFSCVIEANYFSTCTSIQQTQKQIVVLLPSTNVAQ